MNVLTNAIQAVDGKGTITISTHIEGNDAVIRISDDGVGIPEEVMHRVFEPFFTTKDVGQGTGLGLSISYGIIEKHGGQINVTSELGKGTDFDIRIPVRQGT